MTNETISKLHDFKVGEELYYTDSKKIMGVIVKVMRRDVKVKQTDGSITNYNKNLAHFMVKENLD